jgi:hypothetical protein
LPRRIRQTAETDRPARLWRDTESTLSSFYDIKWIPAGVYPDVYQGRNDNRIQNFLDSYSMLRETYNVYPTFLA